jgi:uncharacterized protein (TIGR02265 family)
MPTDRRELEARLAAARPTDTARGLVFNALFDTLEEHLGPAAAKACDPTGKGHRAEFISYPARDVLQIAYRGADQLERVLGSAGLAFRAFGYRTTTNLFASRLGATLLAMVARGGLRDILEQTTTAYRSMVSYGDRHIEWLGTRHLRLTCRHDLLPTDFHLGVLEAAADSKSVQIVVLEGHATGLLDASYELAWEEPAVRAG